MKWKHEHGHTPDPDVFVSLDPGKHAVGYAIFIDRELKACGLAKQAGDVKYHWMAEEYTDEPTVCRNRSWPERIVMEIPQIYDRRRWKGNPNDLLPIIAHGALIAGTLHPIYFETVTPEDWKGQVPKEIQNERDRRALTPTELDVLTSAPVAASKLHNVIDAVGVGLWALKRQLR